MIMATYTRRTALWWCLACLACIASPALAKVETGTVKLDSVTTEQLIGRFGVTEKGSLTLKLTTAKKGWERGEHALHILVFRDESYKRWRDMIKKGSLCQERNRLADIEKAVDLPHPLATHAGHGFEYFVDPETGRSYRINLESGESDWAEPDNHPEGPLNRVEHRETTFTTPLVHHRPKGRGRDVERTPVSAHWYVVVADCRLEFYDAHPPPMKYHLTFLRGDEGTSGGTSHLPADLRGVGVLYWTLLVAMVALAVPGRSAIVGQYRRLGRVHALVVGVGVAYALQTASIALELAHLAVFSRNGQGLQWRFTFFAADFAAEVAQGVAELLASLMLLFLACGWTTVSLGTAGARLLGSLESGGGIGGSAGSAGAEAEKREDEAGRARRGGKNGGGLGREIRDRVPDGVVAVFKGLLKDDDDPRVKARIQSVTRALQSPARLFARGAAVASSVAGAMPAAQAVPGFHPMTRAASRMSLGAFLVIALACVQIFLEIAARAYTDDFSGFHDHEHWPGYGLCALRLALAALFAVGNASALQSAEMQDPDAARFLRDLRAVGLGWMLAFPGLVATAWMLPAMWRHRWVTGGCVLLQSTGLVGLGYLVSTSERFLAVSTVAPRSASVAGNVAGARGIASKLAVD